jgi:hypothetical protein
MNRLENELHNAMRREEPPEGFADRVLARVSERKHVSRMLFLMRPSFRWALAGALCLLLVVAGVEYRQDKQEQARGEAAKAQLMLALRITAGKLQLAQEKVQQIGALQRY